MNILIKQLESLIDKELPLVSNLSNASSLLNKLPNINWCGFYLVSGNRLILGPFQGEPACTVIPFEKGVCGYCYRKKETVIVDDVNKFEGHIACSSISKSEIVTPIIKDNEVKALIDIDAPIIKRFTSEDKELLEQFADVLKELF